MGYSSVHSTRTHTGLEFRANPNRPNSGGSLLAASTLLARRGQRQAAPATGRRPRRSGRRLQERFRERRERDFQPEIDFARSSPARDTSISEPDPANKRENDLVERNVPSVAC